MTSAVLTFEIHPTGRRTDDFRDVLVQAELPKVARLYAIEEVDTERDGRLGVADEVVDDRVTTRPRTAHRDDPEDLFVDALERRDRLDLLTRDPRIHDDGCANGAIWIANENHSHFARSLEREP